jgi:methyl-accepting chemotaxis protein
MAKINIATLIPSEAAKASTIVLNQPALFLQNNSKKYATLYAGNLDGAGSAANFDGDVSVIGDVLVNGKWEVKGQDVMVLIHGMQDQIAALQSLAQSALSLAQFVLTVANNAQSAASTAQSAAARAESAAHFAQMTANQALNRTRP